MSGKNLFLLIGLLGATLLLTACGGGDEGADPAGNDHPTISASCRSEKFGECIDYVWLWAEFKDRFKTEVCESEAKGVWADTPCDHTGMIGGCQSEVVSFKQIVWLMSSSFDLTQQKENCLKISGRVWVEP